MVLDTVYIYTLNTSLPEHYSRSLFFSMFLPLDRAIDKPGWSQSFAAHFPRVISDINVCIRRMTVSRRDKKFGKYAFAQQYIYIYICTAERKRERERHRQRETGRDRDRETDRETEKDRFVYTKMKHSRAYI